MAPKLLKVDKNGTKHWTDSVCPKCNGSGYLPEYKHFDWGVCYKCGGSGQYITNWKEYTPEYAKKLEERRLARLRKKAPEENARWLERNGFSADGKTWVVIGNTYDIKDELKEAGAKWNGLLGWHLDHDPVIWPAFTVTTDDVCRRSLADQLFWDDYSVIAALISELREKHRPASGSEYLGAVGEKLTVRVRLVRIFTYETHFTYRGETNFIYKFADEEGNALVWKTSCPLDLEEGREYEVSGKVKEHSEYKGEKQTALTRCKVTA